MGFFNFFRKRSNHEASTKQNALLSFAYLEEVYKRMAGEPLSFGAKLVSTEILAGRPATYDLVKTPETFRLGVINCFALTAAMHPDKKMLGVIVVRGGKSISDPYRQDHFGPNRISVSEYLSAFRIDIIPEDSLTSLKEFRTYMRKTKNVVLKLAITTMDNYIDVGYKYKGVVRLLIFDNGDNTKLVAG